MCQVIAYAHVPVLFNSLFHKVNLIYLFIRVNRVLAPFDLSHRVLDFGQKSLKLFMSYLTDRKHRVRIGSSVSEFLTILLGVPQGSVLGPILFNIFVNDMLFAVNEASICNFADDNTLYVCDQDITNVLRRLKKDLDVVVNWFSSNGMVENPDKFKVIFPGSQNVMSINIGPLQLKSTEEVIPLGVKLDSQLSFYPHIKDICKTASAKTKALMRIRRYLTQKQVDRLNTAHVICHLLTTVLWYGCFAANRRIT